jgi:predicted ATP-binding protein involved in virulence
MKIIKLDLKNYRCFEEFSMEFPSTYMDFDGNEQPINLHVLLADNMVGKSAILKALRIALSVCFQKMSKEAKIGYPFNTTINREEHRVLGNDIYNDLANEVSIFVELYWHLSGDILIKKGTLPVNFKTFIFGKFKNSVKGKAMNYTPNQHIASSFLNNYNRVLEKKEGVNPLFLYIGTEYIHVQQSNSRSFDLNGASEQGYWYCLDDSNMEKYVFNWFEKLKKTINEQEKSEAAYIMLGGNFPAFVLDTFQIAVQSVLPEITQIEWVLNTLSKAKEKEYLPVFKIEKEGYRTYDMLSDGYRYLVLLIGEMVVRGTLLNKHIKNDILKELTGVVLIDEFGIHLHPGMQSETLGRLSKTFPQLQFIITTHSPLLINGLRKEQIHILREAEDGTRLLNILR